MHPQAYEWVAAHARRLEPPASVLDLGGRDINGSVRALFGSAQVYTVVDVQPGEGVDIVVDASVWTPDREYDLVVCCETFEHTAAWPAICVTAFKALRPGGWAIFTMAGPGRPQHSAIDGGWTLHPGEHYANIKPERLRGVLSATGFRRIVVDQQFAPADVRAVGQRP